MLGEIGNLVEHGRLRFHVRHTDSTDPRENWSARGPVASSSLDNVGFSANSRTCKLVANTWKPGVVEEHSSATLPASDTRLGTVQAQFQSFFGMDMEMDKVELVDDGTVVWQGPAPQGKIRIENLPVRGYSLRILFKGSPMEFLAAWEPTSTSKNVQICHLPYSLEA